MDNTIKTVELCELAGEHYFSGIEIGTIMYPKYYGSYLEECNYVKFTLDGIHYMGIENPADGYRSICRDIEISETAPAITFEPQKVICSMKENSEYGEHEVLIVTDCETGGVVLEIGTLYYDDYYPCFHLEYHPENMACNIGRE